MVEEVLGGMDQFLMALEARVSRIEGCMGLLPEGTSTSGLVGDVERLKAELAKVHGLTSKRG
jgi:hypothetical protein